MLLAGRFATAKEALQHRCVIYRAAPLLYGDVTIIWNVPYLKTIRAAMQESAPPEHRPAVCGLPLSDAYSPHRWGER